ncbi:hypothetical protein ACGF5O_48775 [Streptomyces sp. NPDC048291]|uniref:hypothetical protein n=1 Tax=Streptomyces sp. NPDC048291 TaxID=3365530 RepID=UPI003719D8F3
MPALRKALLIAMERRNFLTISGTALSALAADWAGGSHDTLAQARDGKQQVSEDLVAFLEASTRYLAGLPTEQRQDPSSSRRRGPAARMTSRGTHGGPGAVRRAGAVARPAQALSRAWRLALGRA